MPETRVLGVEVTSISQYGFCVRLEDRDLFLLFEDFPRFKDAEFGAIRHVEQPQADHLYWPDLDVDLTIDAIEHPEIYPLQPGL